MYMDHAMRSVSRNNKLTQGHKYSCIQ